MSSWRQQCNLKDEVVVVTGGSGFLGQHVVRCLQQNAPWVKEIRVVDLVPYVNKLGHPDTNPVRSFRVDVSLTTSSDAELSEAFAGATLAIHLAAVVSLGFFPDEMRMRATNEVGTANVVRMCERHNIRALVYASTASVVVRRFAGCYYYPESRIEQPTPQQMVLSVYAASKMAGERITLAANSEKLRTLALRPPVLFGELDSRFVTNALKVTKRLGGMLPRLGHPDQRVHCTYVGNAAWAHVFALEKLCSEPSLGEVSGQAYFITDDVPVDNVFDFLEPILQLRGYRTASFSLPGPIAFTIVRIAHCVIRLVCSKEPEAIPLPPVDVFDFFNNVLVFNRIKATLRLGYEPLYSSEEATKRANEYYQKVELD